MPKPSRRERRLGKAKPPRRPIIVAPPVARKSAEPAPRLVQSVPTREEYAYVYQDLKRIAFVAGTLLAALVVLKLFLPS
ncbi:MAG: hypothetical protein HYZ68_00270 [Chloroflexi bacterium]|nr:hypothetical protein [Chloroflexota bacterium]